jgi:hypothetical protein
MYNPYYCKIIVTNRFRTIFLKMGLVDFSTLFNKV